MSEQDFEILCTALRNRLTSVYSVIRVPYGWREHVANLHEELFNIYSDYRLTTCTESVGRLLFRVDTLPLDGHQYYRRFHETIEKYEVASANICMVCGSHDATALNAWARALCEGCNEAHADYFAKRNDLYTSNTPVEEWPEDVMEFFTKIKGEGTALTPAG